MIRNFSAWDKKEKRWFNPKDIALFGDGVIIYSGPITPHPIEIVHYVGKQDKNGKEIREKDIMLGKLPEVACGRNYYEELRYTEKRVYGEVRIRTCGGLGLLIRKVIPEGLPGLKRGSFIRIKTDRDEVIGNVLDTPDVIE
jgi:hypothetical protein